MSEKPLYVLSAKGFCEICRSFCAAAGVKITADSLSSFFVCAVFQHGFKRRADASGRWPPETEACAQLFGASGYGFLFAVLREEYHRHAAKEAFGDGVHAAMGEKRIRLFQHRNLIHMRIHRNILR